MIWFRLIGFYPRFKTRYIYLAHFVVWFSGIHSEGHLLLFYELLER